MEAHLTYSFQNNGKKLYYKAMRRQDQYKFKKESRRAPQILLKK
jgi:hypothetical protein